jgi:hypothetical protein
MDCVDIFAISAKKSQRLLEALPTTAKLIGIQGARPSMSYAHNKE